MQQTKLLRVTQVDAIHLDQEIEKIFSELIKNCTDTLPLSVSIRINPELNLLVKLLVLYFSIVKNGCTFGQQLLVIKYESMSTLKKVLYVILNTLGYGKERLESFSPQSELNTTFAKLDVIIKIFSMINLTLFLKTGRKPQLVERILGLNQVYAQENVHRSFGSKYMTRELLWNGLIELLVNILPFVNYHKMRRIIRNLNPLHKKGHITFENNRMFTLKTKCAHCGQSPVLPHHMGCPHVFCYSCLKGNQIADIKYECPLCGYHNLNVICERVSINYIQG